MEEKRERLESPIRQPHRWRSHVLFERFSGSANHACANCCGYILHVRSGGNFLYQFQEFFLSRPSGRRICISRPTDLDIITSEREITLVEQLALRAICCTSAPFMAVCGPETRSALRSLQAADLFRSGYLNLISLQRVLMVPSCSLDRLPWSAVWWNEVGRSCQDAQERKKVLRVEIKNVEIRRGQIYSSRVHSYLCSVS